MCEDRSSQTTYAHEHLLPIWERWTDGNLAMRRSLECESADPKSHEERRNILFETQCRFQGRGESAANMAALLAAQACQYALLGYPLEMVRRSELRLYVGMSRLALSLTPAVETCAVQPGQWRAQHE